LFQPIVLLQPVRSAITAIAELLVIITIVSNRLCESKVIVWYRLQPERRVLMSDVRLPPTNADPTAAAAAIKEGDEIEVRILLAVIYR